MHRPEVQCNGHLISNGKEESRMEEVQIQFEIEELEERIAPGNANGQLGYEGQPGNQGGH